MADHDELVAEMLVLEQMGTQERQKLAKKRRMQQLKKWSQREKEWIAKEKQLNKRLASKINEENNGLNLKQYTTYNSNQRTKKRLTSTTNKYNVNGTSKTDIAEKQNTSFDKKPLSANNNTLVSVDGPYANLTPTGRVHFNVGVMLLEAAARNDYDEVKRLLSLGVSPDSINHDGLTALHQCCIDASELIMNLLLEYGANVDARDTERWTPLHAACTCGHLNLVKILVEHGADLLAVNGDGNMPFDICEDEATLDYIESQMIKRGITQEMIDLTRASNELQMLSSLEELAATGGDADLNYADENGVTQLHIATTHNYLPVVKFLLKHGVNVNVCDNDKWTPLHGLACWGSEQHIKVAEMLVEAGADLNAKTSEEETVFDLCDNAELLERLSQLKDELESKQANGTDRLRRTQSRTNSRVHSVRRTRVQDKNQISRREAREEAMLRVESSENINGNTAGHSSSSLGELRPQTAETSAFNRTLSLLETSLNPLETNLDQPSTSNEGLYNAEDNSTDRIDSSTSLSTARNQPNIPLTTLRGDDRHGAATRIPHSKQEPEQVKISSTIIADATSKSESSSEKLVAHSNNQICDPNQQLVSATAKGSTIVQVHLAPINYTLSNLKKHRSDLRLRGVSGAPVHLDPKTSPSPERPRDAFGEVAPANGWSINKFHGQPSETIEIRRNHKCCVII